MKGGDKHESNQKGQSTTQSEILVCMVPRETHRSSGSNSNNVLRGVGSMMIRDMKEALMTLYGLKWKDKVMQMADNQIVACYYRFEQAGMFNQPKKREQPTTNKHIQLTLFR